MAGKFVISLDFELHWGGAEVWDLITMKNYFLNARSSIPSILNLFKENNVRATWATVGFLFAKDKKQLLQFSPELKPSYRNSKLSYYNYFHIVGENEKNDPFHYGGSLIEKIISTNGQELGTHTFSHYYCNEEGQSVKEFEADLLAAQSISKENFGVNLKSLVFPRNQYNNLYLDVVRRLDIAVVRSNPDVWFWKKSYGKVTSLLRAIDTLYPISNSLTFNEAKIVKEEVVELPASRFFRPYSIREKLIQHLKIERIKSEMLYAAQSNRCYHLWWHPHNFGVYPQENISQLKEIIIFYNHLNKKYGFQSKNMSDYIE
ncbi:polysaccharide deacetylase family protein [Moheibacter sp.]|uniref:polysaccharide deacetylase family protein n=1 Tax=Moheibacter sp. TaxID=1965316 RepID=UPI003C780A55